MSVKTVKMYKYVDFLGNEILHRSKHARAFMKTEKYHIELSVEVTSDDITKEIISEELNEVIGTQINNKVPIDMKDSDNGFNLDLEKIKALQKKEALILLTATDHIFNPDFSALQTEKDAYASYRQALRGFADQTSDPLLVDFPIHPYPEKLKDQTYVFKQERSAL